MIARLRELLDVARAMLRRRRRDFVFVSGSPGACIEGMEHRSIVPLTYKTDSAPADLSFREAMDRNPLVSETGAALIGELVPEVSPGLVPCPTCETLQQPREGHMAVHFASATDQRPCVGSWPARKAAE